MMKQILLLLILCLSVACYPVAADIAGQPKITTAELELLIHQQVNRERQKHGLPELASDELLAEIARRHSRDMARNHFFSHTNLQGEDPAERAKSLGWDKKKQIGPNTWALGLGENIYLNHLYDKVVTVKQNGVTVKKEYLWKSLEDIVRSTVQGWMDSRLHRENILSPQYDRQGIGVAISGNDIYITEDMF